MKYKPSFGSNDLFAFIDHRFQQRHRCLIFGVTLMLNQELPTVSWDLAWHASSTFAQHMAREASLMFTSKPKESTRAPWACKTLRTPRDNLKIFILRVIQKRFETNKSDSIDAKVTCKHLIVMKITPGISIHDVLSNRSNCRAKRKQRINASRKGIPFMNMFPKLGEVYNLRGASPSEQTFDRCRPVREMKNYQIFWNVAPKLILFDSRIKVSRTLGARENMELTQKAMVVIEKQRNGKESNLYCCLKNTFWD